MVLLVSLYHRPLLHILDKPANSLDIAIIWAPAEQGGSKILVIYRILKNKSLLGWGGQSHGCKIHPPPPSLCFKHWINAGMCMINHFRTISTFYVTYTTQWNNPLKSYYSIGFRYKYQHSPSWLGNICPLSFAKTLLWVAIVKYEVPLYVQRSSRSLTILCQWWLTNTAPEQDSVTILFYCGYDVLLAIASIFAPNILELVRKLNLCFISL